jgi:hypothetical protein
VWLHIFNEGFFHTAGSSLAKETFLKGLEAYAGLSRNDLKTRIMKNVDQSQAVELLTSDKFKAESTQLIGNVMSFTMTNVKLFSFSLYELYKKDKIEQDAVSITLATFNSKEDKKATEKVATVIAEEPTLDSTNMKEYINTLFSKSEEKLLKKFSGDGKEVHNPIGNRSSVGKQQKQKNKIAAIKGKSPSKKKQKLSENSIATATTTNSILQTPPVINRNIVFDQADIDSSLSQTTTPPRNQVTFHPNHEGRGRGRGRGSGRGRGRGRGRSQGRGGGYPGGRARGSGRGQNSYSRQY